MRNLTHPFTRYGLLVMPLVFLAWEMVVYGAKGPNWMMVPQDLGYNYLLNGLNVLNGDPIGSLIHPGITIVYYIAGVIWLTHAVAGSGPMDFAVISDPEFYFATISHSVTLLMALALYVMGRMAYRGLGSLRLTMLVQFFAIITPSSLLVSNSYGSPESIVMILMMLQIGLTLATLDGELSDRRSRWNYAGISAVICGAAIATKFIAAPMLILPFLTIPTVRWKACFIVLAGVATLVLMSPVYLIPENWQQFGIDMGAILGSSSSERMQQGSVSILLNILSQLELTFAAYKSPFYFLGIGLALFAATVVAGPLRKALFGTPAYSLFVISQVTIVAAFLFIFIRPKAHYLVPYMLIQGMGFALFFLMVRRHVLDEWLSRRDRRTVTLWTTSGVVVVCALLFQQNFEDPYRGYYYLKKINTDAHVMSGLAFGDSTPGNNAIVTAIQASNIPTAFNHANQASRFFHWKHIDDLLPSNHFDYAFDGENAWNHSRYPISLSELMEKYDKVLFWSTKGNFINQEWRVAPKAVWRDLKVGVMERLAVLVALSIRPQYDARTGAEENRKRGWISRECAPDHRCLQVRIPEWGRKVVTHFRFYADTADQVAVMPVKWRVEGSQDGKVWQVLDEFFDDDPWVAAEAWRDERANRTYRLNNDRFYLYYRFVSRRPDGAPSTWPGRVLVYSKGGDAPDILLIPRTTWFLRADELAEEIVPQPMWEQTGDFPKTLVKELAVPRMAMAYTLSTGDDGPDGRDSWGRMPLTWSLQGSVDGKQWVELDRQENVPAWSSNEARFFSVKKSGFHKYFRLMVDKAASDWVIRLYHLKVIGPGQSNPAQERIIRLQPFYEMAGPFPLGVQMNFDQAVRASSYQLKAGPHGVDSTERMPLDWILMGSNDGDSWRILDKRSGESGWTNLERRNYGISHPGEYRHYRLVVLNSSQNWILRIDEIKFFESRLSQTEAEAVSEIRTVR